MSFSELLHFVAENKMSGGLSKEMALEISKMVDNYKVCELLENHSIITADFGHLGSIIIREINSFEPKTLNYESGNYDYVSIQTSSTRRILWTDYSNEEPYNRQSGLYCDGATFESLGKSVLETEEYREFNAVYNYKSNICFGVWGFYYNNYYGCIKFGLCIPTSKVGEFVSKLRKIINK